jgi:hypothetical protein
VSTERSEPERLRVGKRMLTKARTEHTRGTGLAEQGSPTAVRARAGCALLRRHPGVFLKAPVWIAINSHDPIQESFNKIWDEIFLKYL